MHKSIFTLLASILLLCGCIPVQHLNDPARSKPSGSGYNKYETIEKNGIAVGYTLNYSKSKNFTGYALGVTLKNNTSMPVLFRPAILVQDADGFLIQAVAYQDFINWAAALAATPVPQMPVEQPYQYNTEGTITSANGTSTYSATTTTSSSVVSSFASGWRAGAIIGSANDRAEGKAFLQFSNQWLKSEYQLPSGVAVKGILVFPTLDKAKLPIKVVIQVAGEKFEFFTISK